MRNTRTLSRQLQTAKIVYLGDLIAVRYEFEQTGKTCSAGQLWPCRPTSSAKGGPIEVRQLALGYLL
jgi:hypothetical protein